MKLWLRTISCGMWAAAAFAKLLWVTSPGMHDFLTAVTIIGLVCFVLTFIYPGKD